MEFNVQFMEDAFPLLLKAVPVTLAMTAAVLMLSLLPAFVMAAARAEKKKWASRFIALYVSFIRGTPLILQLLLLYSLLPSLLNWYFKSIGSDFNVFEAVKPFWYGVMVFTLHTTALLSEVFRSAILSVPAGQMDAGLSVGMKQSSVYWRIILPQALRSAIPNICNVTIGLIKGTSLAFFLGVKDIMAEARVQASFGFNYVEAYLDVFLLYLLICTIVQILYWAGERYVTIGGRNV